jgi:ABC-type antimicrobial peptide transport system permease subunit
VSELKSAFRTLARDPWVLAIASLIAAALAANAVPARRAASVNPVDALRFEG